MKNKTFQLIQQKTHIKIVAREMAAMYVIDQYARDPSLLYVASVLQCLAEDNFVMFSSGK